MEKNTVESWTSTQGGYHCYIIKHEPVGGGMGYVGIPPSHPLFGKSYDELFQEDRICVHGGLTYSGKGDDEHPDVQQDGKLWYLGWDAKHFCSMKDMFVENRSMGVLVTLDFLREETNNLAKQFFTLSSSSSSSSSNAIVDGPRDPNDIPRKQSDDV